MIKTKETGKKLRKLLCKHPIDTDIPRLSDCYEQIGQPQRYVYCFNCKKVFLNDLLFTDSVLCPHCHQDLCHAGSKGEAIEAVWTDKLTEADFGDGQARVPFNDIKKAMRRIRKETGW